MNIEQEEKEPKERVGVEPEKTVEKSPGGNDMQGGRLNASVIRHGISALKEETSSARMGGGDVGLKILHGGTCAGLR